jgi:hypothetical protein
MRVQPGRAAWRTLLRTPEDEPRLADCQRCTGGFGDDWQGLLCLSLKRERLVQPRRDVTRRGVRLPLPALGLLGHLQTVRQ